jgi:hypothetical protein
MATEPEIRKLVTFLEIIRMEGGVESGKSLKKCAVAAVIKNPFAGVYHEDLTLLMEYGEYLGEYLTKAAVSALRVEPSAVHGFGKACVVGVSGEHEHAGAVMHPRLGAPMRNFLGAGKAIIPSVKKIAAAGSSLDVPFLYKDAMLLRSHYDTITIRIGDAPRPDEIVVAVAFSTGGRPRARVGGFSLSEVKGENGLD